MARSPNYPAHGLSEAIALVELVYNKEKKTQIAGEDVAKALGYASLSGNARSKIASLKKYGLLEGDEAKGMRVSDVAVHILFPASEADLVDSRRSAALMPELFKYLYEEKREGSDESIKNYLVSKLDFTPSGAMQAVQSFRDTVMFADLNETGYNASKTPDKAEAQLMHTETKSASTFESISPLITIPHSGAVNAWTWTLSMPRNVKAELKIAGEPTKSDIGRLKKQIEFLEESFDEGTE